jgi:hypothetical protein
MPPEVAICLHPASRCPTSWSEAPRVGPHGERGHEGVVRQPAVEVAQVLPQAQRPLLVRVVPFLIVSRARRVADHSGRG